MFRSIKEPSHFTEFPKVVPRKRDEFIVPKCSASSVLPFLLYHTSFYNGLLGNLSELQGVFRAKLWNPKVLLSIKINITETGQTLHNFIKHILGWVILIIKILLNHYSTLFKPHPELCKSNVKLKYIIANITYKKLT